MKHKTFGHYILEVLLSIDQVINAILLGEGDTTLSARAYIREQEGSKGWSLFRRFVDGLFFKQVHHCRGAFVFEKRRRLLWLAKNKNHIKKNM